MIPGLDALTPVDEQLTWLFQGYLHNDAALEQLGDAFPESSSLEVCSGGMLAAGGSAIVGGWNLSDCWNMGPRVLGVEQDDMACAKTHELLEQVQASLLQALKSDDMHAYDKQFLWVAYCATQYFKNGYLPHRPSLCYASVKTSCRTGPRGGYLHSSFAFPTHPTPPKHISFPIFSHFLLPRASHSHISHNLVFLVQGWQFTDVSYLDVSSGTTVGPFTMAVKPGKQEDWALEFPWKAVVKDLFGTSRLEKFESRVSSSRDSSSRVSPPMSLSRMAWTR